MIAANNSSCFEQAYGAILQETICAGGSAVGCPPDLNEYTRDHCSSGNIEIETSCHQLLAKRCSILPLLGPIIVCAKTPSCTKTLLGLVHGVPLLLETDAALGALGPTVVAHPLCTSRPGSDNAASTTIRRNTLDDITSILLVICCQVHCGTPEGIGEADEQKLSSPPRRPHQVGISPTADRCNARGAS